MTRVLAKTTITPPGLLGQASNQEPSVTSSKRSLCEINQEVKSTNSWVLPLKAPIDLVSAGSQTGQGCREASVAEIISVPKSGGVHF